MTGESKWLQQSVVAEDLHLNIRPEIVWTLSKSHGGIGTRIAGAGNERSIGRGKLNFNNYFDGFRQAAMIQLRLLGAIAGGTLAGKLNDLGEWVKRVTEEITGPLFGGARYLVYLFMKSA